MGQESQESAIQGVVKVNFDRFDLHRWSRWVDHFGRLVVITGFHYGFPADKRHVTRFEKVGVDLLLVHEEMCEYVTIGRMYNMVINGKLMPWKDQPQANF